MHRITKSFNLCFGHRVWSQVLDAEFSENTQCSCRHMHGHEGVVEVTLECLPHQGLQRGMVTDFRHLSWFKQFLDDTLDHKFVVDLNDPLFGMLFKPFSFSLEPIDVVRSCPDSSIVSSTMTVARRPVLRYDLEQPAIAGAGSMSGDVLQAHKEYLEGFVVVNFVPTSENFSQWLHSIISWKMERIAKVHSVRWWESAKSNSLFIAE